MADATTTGAFPEAGVYRMWVRTRDWVAPRNVLGAPGRFQLNVDGSPLSTTFGTEGAEWYWQDSSQIQVGPTVSVALHDLTGFEGCCDAIVFCRDSNWQIPNEPEALAEFRRKTLDFPEKPEQTEQYDLVVVGGGVAGT